MRVRVRIAQKFAYMHCTPSDSVGKNYNIMPTVCVFCNIALTIQINRDCIETLFGIT